MKTIKTTKMKTIKQLALFALVGTSIFTSCKKDEPLEPEPVGPTLTISPMTTSKWKGDTIVYNYSISSNEKITSLVATPNTSLLSVKEVTTFNGNFSATGTVQYILPTSSLNNGDVISIKFKALDKDGAEYAAVTTTTINITEPVSAGTPMVNETTNGEVWNLIGTNAGAWDLVTNMAVLASGLEADKDMKNTTTTSSTTTGTFESEWTVGNTTVFVKDNAFDYTNAEVENAETSFNSGTPLSTISNVQTGDVYIAKLRGGSDYAVIKITNVVITTSDNNDKITFSYKK